MTELVTPYSAIVLKLKSAKWARILRNKISFHYDPRYALDAMMKLEDAHPLRMFLWQHRRTHTLSEFAEEITSRPMSPDSVLSMSRMSSTSRTGR